MGKRVVTLIVVVVLGIIVGVSVVKKQAQAPLLRAMVEQQESILIAQKRIENKLFPSDQPVFLNGKGDTVSPGTAPVNNVQIRALEARLVVLEDKLSGLVKKLEPVLKQLDRPKPPPEDYSKVYDLKIKESPMRGKKDAVVTIVEFSDMECPYCSRFHKVINDVLATFPDDVNLVFKHFPLSFHKKARSAAKAALAAEEQGKFFEMTDALLANQRNLSEEFYKKTAKDLGLNVKKFIKDLEKKDSEWESILQRDMALGSQSAVKGTPTFFINGRKTRARNLAQFKQEVEKILKEKK